MSMRAKISWLFFITAVILLLNGCKHDSDDYTEGYKLGHEKGYKQGKEEGIRLGSEQTREDQQVRTFSTSAITGFLAGVIIAMGGIGLCNRQRITSYIQQMKNNRKIRKYMKSLYFNFDEDLSTRLIVILSKHKALSDKVILNKGIITNSLREKIVPAMESIPGQAVELVKVQQNLRKTAKDFPINERIVEANIRTLQNKLDSTEDSRLRTDIKEEIQVLSEKLNQQKRLQDNIARCESKLNSLSVFMENTEIQMANWNTLTSFDAFNKLNIDVTHEVETLEKAIEDALRNLSLDI